MTPSLIVWSLAAPFAVMTAGVVPQAAAVDPAPPSAIERALVERACSAPGAASPGDTAAHDRCVAAQLSLLRADFGLNLKRLSAAERSGLDAACSRLETTHGRDGYLDCVNVQLVALRLRRSRAAAPRTPTPETPAAVLPAAAAPEPPAAAPEAVAPPQRAGSLTAIVGWVLLAVAAIAGGSLVVIRNRRARRTCRECGVVMTDSGDLCAACRHAAAESLRRAATERMEQVRAEEAERRRKLQFEEEERRQQALREAEAREREQHEAQRREENARRQREEEARRQCLVAEEGGACKADDEFDPYAVLGVRRDTPPEEIRAAYEQARSKYDQDSVAHLGVDVQEHFREKALAVDRAYQMLAG